MARHFSNFPLVHHDLWLVYFPSKPVQLVIEMARTVTGGVDVRVFDSADERRLLCLMDVTGREVGFVA